MPQAFIPSALPSPTLQVTIEPAAEPGRESFAFWSSAPPTA
ncbi:MAG: hypothetical protein ACFCVB_00220 [Nodosilinea sp.]